MNDFETRARAAGRSIHDAVDDTASVTITPRKSRGPIRALAIAAIVTLIAVIGTILVVNSRRADIPTSDVTTFCERINQAELDPQGVGRDLSIVEQAPRDIREDLQTVIDLRRHPSTQANDQPRVLAAATRYRIWREINCFPDAAQPSANPTQRRFAPSAFPPWFVPCAATNAVQASRGVVSTPAAGHLTIFGAPSAPDPYQRPMVGVVSSPSRLALALPAGTSVSVPGHSDAQLRPMTTPENVPLTGAGITVSWADGDRTISVVGRGFTNEREAELVEIAGHVVVDATGAHLDPTLLGDQLQLVFDGTLSSASLPFTTSNTGDPTFSIWFDRGLDSFTGKVQTLESFAATRFFGTGLQPSNVNGRPALVGQLWMTDQQAFDVPTVVMWRESDDITLSMQVYPRSTASPTVEQIQDLASQTKVIDRTTWEKLVRLELTCSAALAH